MIPLWKRIFLGTAIVLLFYGGSAGFIVATFSQISQHTRSNETQGHGIRARGRVWDVKEHKICRRGSCDYTSKIDVTLARRVDGVTETTVHVAAVSPLVDGDEATVLVDPKQPSYAELPGRKFATGLESLGALIGAVVLTTLSLMLTVLIVRGLWRKRGRRRVAGPSGAA